MNFRKDINGLRAIAVIAVVIFHFNESWLKPQLKYDLLFAEKERKKLKEILCFCFFTFLFSGNLLGAAETLPEQFLQIDGKILEDRARVEISWPKVNGTKMSV